jgi:hypothetical protein
VIFAFFDYIDKIIGCGAPAGSNSAGAKAVAPLLLAVFSAGVMFA